MDITGVLLITAFPLGLALLGVGFCLWLMKKAGIQPLEGPYWKIYHEHFTGTQESPRFSGSRRSGRSGGSRLPDGLFFGTGKSLERNGAPGRSVSFWKRHLKIQAFKAQAQKPIAESPRCLL